MPSFDKPSPRESETTKEVSTIKETVTGESQRIKKLGEWPEWVDTFALVERIPTEGGEASGFDAGIASALDLIPREKQKLAAVLHAAYTPEAVDQIREEMKDLDPDSETTWWAAACKVCLEGKMSQEQFLQQIKDFKKLSKDPEARKLAGQEAIDEMMSTFSTDSEFGEDVAYGTVDGCMQGAYIAGHEFAVMYAEKHGLYFIGTYEPSLGLEDFNWSDEKDEKNRPNSGPVHGSKQYVKCANTEEAKRALEIVKAKFKK